MLSAYSEGEMVEEATRAGVLAYLVKPFRREELGPAIEIARARFRELLAIEGERDVLADRIETEEALQRARLLLMRRHAISEREAARRMQAQAVTTGRPIRAIADALLLTEHIETPLR
jgi:response regulator NasT